VSIVGKRGVGKSTVSSLLSGNDTMFESGSGTVGTTTQGADMSTVIPTQEYAELMSKNLQRTVVVPAETLPLFLIDSEGMGVRGDKFDFVTTSPPAVVAKIIVYIGDGTLDTNDLLFEIDDYLKGLDNIILDEEGGGGDVCTSPR
jgi:hypothetical protein